MDSLFCISILLRIINIMRETPFQKSRGQRNSNYEKLSTLVNIAKMLRKYRLLLSSFFVPFQVIYKPILNFRNN